MTISVFDLFKVGIGPSSSHTVGPMRAAGAFVDRLKGTGVLHDTAALRVLLYGSLGATGRGHGSVEAIVAGLAGARPESVDPDTMRDIVAEARADARIYLGGAQPISFAMDEDIELLARTRLPFHTNGMLFAARDAVGRVLLECRYYSIGGGFVLDEDEIDGRAAETPVEVPYPFGSADELLSLTAATGRSISELVLANEMTRRSGDQVRADLLAIWAVMQGCVERGMSSTGVLPGTLRVRRRAATLFDRLRAEAEDNDPLRAMEWVTLYAMAVNEENAAGGRVVTAPTNGAAGIIPAVLHYIQQFVTDAEDRVVEFLLTAGAIGQLMKENASISGAEVGCQGEVGSACAMAAAGLAAVLGGTPAQIENAAEIGMEHNLGLTCDPIGGLVQIPCIERNGIAAVKAITAARMAIRGDGHHHVSLDQVIQTMRATGADMLDKYKETSQGGLAVAVVEC
ncbi:L-serine dehydratase [Nocardia brasiliensis NBRC 14402]|uniref:L-serine ammonia-lyase n=1 Tax=Nocardia brasiliensis TaxID=37326 RepID=UPI00030CF692|nr:L-serine ammonia-lyase [Nocardia brasiliensis]ASF07877.1 L-serine ammonia-lyase [Nocardia brasiliensis]GAJ84842.1 L-serine dehydratase [Nocardia brasiliensis NBRC 14402]SUB54530.1 L-serine dehydratase 2 [Nocardia brasiliensis]